MANIRVERKVSLTRGQVSEALASLASALDRSAHDRGAEAEMNVAGLTVSVLVPDEVATEFEIEVDGDQVEIELEMKWSTASTSQPTPGAVRRRAR